MISIKKHLILCVTVFVLWAVFYLMGLPSDYYTKWNDAEKVLLILIAFFGIFPFLVVVIGVFLNEDYLKAGIWIGLYGSVGIFVLDLIVVGMIEGMGLQFLFTHWPQSVGYLEAIVIGPLIGAVMKKLTRRV